MPLSESDFDSYLKEYRTTVTGKQLESDQVIGFINDKLSFFEVRGESVGDKRAAYETKNPVY